MAIAVASQQLGSLFGGAQPGNPEFLGFLRDKRVNPLDSRAFRSAISDFEASRASQTGTDFVEGQLRAPSAARGPEAELTFIQNEFNKISFKGSLSDTEDVGAFVPGTALFNELTQAIELADRRDRLQGKTPTGSGISTSINSTGERARLIQRLLAGASVPRNPETAIEKEQRLQKGLITAKETAQAVEKKDRSEIITARAAGPQTLFQREDEIKLPVKLGGGREN